MKQRVLVGGVIHRNDEILIIKRIDGKKIFPGYWEIPGGKIDPKESPQEAVIREVKEETGIDVTIEKIFHTWSCVIEYKGESEHCIEIDFILNAHTISPIILSETEHSEFKWIKKNQIPEKVTPEMRIVMEKAFENIN